jgi:hypothetical protein
VYVYHAYILKKPGYGTPARLLSSATSRSPFHSVAHRADARFLVSHLASAWRGFSLSHLASAWRVFSLSHCLILPALGGFPHCLIVSFCQRLAVSHCLMLPALGGASATCTARASSTGATTRRSLWPSTTPGTTPRRSPRYSSLPAYGIMHGSYGRLFTSGAITRRSSRPSTLPGTTPRRSPRCVESSSSVDHCFGSSMKVLSSCVVVVALYP